MSDWRGITEFQEFTGAVFRRVTLANHDQRGGLLAQGGVAGDKRRTPTVPLRSSEENGY